MDKSKVVGVVTWNIFGKIPIARQVRKLAGLHSQDSMYWSWYVQGGFYSIYSILAVRASDFRLRKLLILGVYSDLWATQSMQKSLLNAVVTVKR